MIGRTIGGRYLLEAVLGEGGSATVYSARDVQLDLPCAVKVLRPGDGRTEQLRARLRAEAGTMARLAHPNILRVYATGSEDDTDWIAMELSPDGSVADRVRQDGPFAARRAIQITLQVLAGLEAAHAAGVIHRDVKPDNLLVHSDGSIKLCDFGIALLDDTTRMTQSGFAMGSLPYMAPEQRVDAHLVGASVDLYATAATLFHLLTGATPVDLFLAPPNSPRFAGMPEGLVELIRQGTHADPARRFPSAAAMAEVLARALPLAADTPLAPQPTGVPFSATTLPETSRVTTRIAEAPESVANLEVHLERDWLARDAEDRRKRARRTSRLWLGFAVTLFAVVVAAGTRLSVDHWIDQEAARQAVERVPLAGTWKGIAGGSQATLDVSGSGTSIRAVFTVGDGAPLALAGEVTRGRIRLATEDPDDGVWHAEIASDGRMDGSHVQEGRRSPFHFVRVPDVGPAGVHSADGGQGG